MEQLPPIEERVRDLVMAYWNESITKEEFKAELSVAMTTLARQETKRKRHGMPRRTPQ